MKHVLGKPLNAKFNGHLWEQFWIPLWDQQPTQLVLADIRLLEQPFVEMLDARFAVQLLGVLRAPAVLMEVLDG